MFNTMYVCTLNYKYKVYTLIETNAAKLAVMPVSLDNLFINTILLNKCDCSANVVVPYEYMHYSSIPTNPAAKTFPGRIVIP